MNKNFISIRLAFGEIENKIYWTTSQIAEKFNLYQCAQWDPHITLFGPFTLNRGHKYSEVYRAIERNSRNFDSLSYSIEGWKIMPSWSLGYVIAHKVKLHPNCENYYQALTSDLLKFVDAPRYPDYKQESEHHHISVLTRMYDEKEARSIYHQLKNHSSIKPIYAELNVPRVYFGAGAFDIPRKKWLQGKELWNRAEWEQTFKAMI